MKQNLFAKIFLFLVVMAKSTLVKIFPSSYEWLKIRPVFATINITDRCCFQCVMCDQWKKKNGDELSTQHWNAILNELKEIGVRSLAFSGGEPFLRTDLLDIVREAQSLGFEISIVTNGYLLTQELVKKAVDAGITTFNISIDAVGKKFDEIRGIKGGFEKVIKTCEALAALKKQGIQTNLYFTLMEPTLNTYRDVFSVAERFGFPFVVNLFDDTPYFFENQKETKEKFWISDGEQVQLREFQDFLRKKKRDNPASVYHSYREINYMAEYFRDPLQAKIPCVASQVRINFDPYGNVYGGCWSIGNFGSAKDTPLREIIESARYQNAQKHMFFKHCPGCSCAYSNNLRFSFSANLCEIGLYVHNQFAKR